MIVPEALQNLIGDGADDSDKLIGTAVAIGPAASATGK
jgi:hypothetical protein